MLYAVTVEMKIKSLVSMMMMIIITIILVTKIIIIWIIDG